MAKKKRKKSAAKTKKKSTPARNKHKTVVRKKAKAAVRKKPARKAKPRGVVGTIVADVKAVIDTLTEAERLHHKMEPHVPPDPE
jgi:hypothetical protein